MLACGNLKNASKNTYNKFDKCHLVLWVVCILYAREIVIFFFGRQWTEINWTLNMMTMTLLMLFAAFDALFLVSKCCFVLNTEKRLHISNSFFQAVFFVGFGY